MVVTAIHLADSDGSRARAKVSLHSNNLVVHRAESEAVRSPGVEVVGRVDRAAGAVVAADRPVLVKGGGSNDGGLVDTLGSVDVVDTAVRCNLTQLGSARGWVVGSKVLDDVVLDERVARPAVDGEVAVSVGVVATREVDDPKERYVSFW